MQFQVKDGEKYRQVLTGEISVAELEPAIQTACKRLNQKAAIPGFRKGKAPRNILESYLGTEALLEEAADVILPQAWAQAVDELHLEPVDRPAVEISQLAKGQPLIFTANFTPRPQVTLGQYQGLSLTRRTLEVTDEDVEKELAAQRERMSQLTEAPEEQPAANGDTVTIDFEGLKDGVPFDGGTGKSYPLVLGSGSFIPGFEEQVEGMKKGEDKEINVTFPENYHEASLANQPVVFKVHVHEIKQKHLPELDDAFAQEVSESANTIEELKAELRQGLEDKNRQAADEDCKNQGVKGAVDNAELDVPPVMVEQRLDEIIEDMARRFQAQGLSLEQFFAYTGQNMSELRKNYREQAETGVKTDLVLEAIIKAEDFTVSEEEMTEEIKDLAAKYWQAEDELRQALEQSGQLPLIEQGVKVRKAVDLIFDHAEIQDETVTHEQVEAERKAAAEAQAKAVAEAQAAEEEKGQDEAQEEPAQTE
ncbi:MAG: trigger factor [Firmicutes bacterium]|nr:trigger factor [Bacillota bacterium]